MWPAGAAFQASLWRLARAAEVGRILFHIAGMIGSPLGAYVAYSMVRGYLAAAAAASMALLYGSILLNGVLFLAAFMGRPRLGTLPLRLSSGGMAGIELREGLAMGNWFSSRARYISGRFR